MPFSNYGELKQELSEWMDRTDITAKASDCVTLAEAGLNRKLESMEVDTMLTGAINSREIDVSALGVKVPLSLFLTDNGREYELLKAATGTFPFSDTSTDPETWSYQEQGGVIIFDCPLGDAYTFRLHHTIKFDLVNDTDTNWLLTNHPDVYLCASIAWGARFVLDGATLQTYAGPLETFVSEVNRQERRKNKGTLTVDPALSVIGRYSNWGVYR